MNPPELWGHQKKAIEMAKGRQAFGLFFDPGTGKTRTAIEILRDKYNQNGVLLRTLIVCPLIVTQNWKAEFLKYSKIKASQITPLQGSGKQRLNLFQKKAYVDDHAAGHIFIMNYESLNMADLYAAIMEWGPEAVIWDESHKLKSISSQRSKLADKLVNSQKQKPYVLSLSGTPVLNTPMDIFMQYKVMDGGATFGPNFYAFRARYFRDKNAGMPKHSYFPNWVLIPGAEEEISKKMAANSLRALKKDCLDLPPFVQQTIKVPMSAIQRKLYDSMLKDYVAYFEKEGKEQITSATLAITKGLRLMQMASGYVKTVAGEEVSIDEKGVSPKQKALKELLEDLAPHHKTIVWAVWKQNYETIKAVCNELGVKYVEVHGDIPEKQKFANVDAFNNDPEIRVLIGHPGSGGIGINMVAASYSIFFSRNFSLEQSLQAEARNYRGGSEIHDKITRIDLVTEDSIEEKIQEALASKLEISYKLLKEITLSEKNNK